MPEKIREAYFVADTPNTIVHEREVLSSMGFQTVLYETPKDFFDHFEGLAQEELLEVGQYAIFLDIDVSSQSFLPGMNLGAANVGRQGERYGIYLAEYLSDRIRKSGIRVPFAVLSNAATLEDRGRLSKLEEADTSFFGFTQKLVHKVDRNKNDFRGLVENMLSTEQVRRVRKSISSNRESVMAASAHAADLISVELSAMEENKPNDPASLELWENQRGFLELILGVLDGVLEHTGSSSSEGLKKATESTLTLSQEIENWYSANKADVVDTGLRIPALAAAVALLKIAGASMGPATVAAIVLIGGPRLSKWIKSIAGG